MTGWEEYVAAVQELATQRAKWSIVDGRLASLRARLPEKSARPGVPADPPSTVEGALAALREADSLLDAAERRPWWRRRPPGAVSRR